MGLTVSRETSKNVNRSQGLSSCFSLSETLSLQGKGRREILGTSLDQTIV